MIKRRNEKQILNKRIFHNNSSPLLFENTNNSNNNKFIINNINNINKKLKFKKKLSSLITSNFKLLNSMSRNKNIFIHLYPNNSFLSSNHNNNTNKFISFDEPKELLSRGELANENANNYMNKYFYPDNDESHEKSNKKMKKLI